VSGLRAPASSSGSARRFLFQRHARRFIYMPRAHWDFR
jgi:hypothetical protein